MAFAASTGTMIATDIPDNYIIISPYLNAVIKGKGDSFTAIRKGRLCCVFDEINYVLIFAFQDL